ncbi:hypothetical protein ACFQH3_04890 [Haladaptatus sp. GCM10025707]|uniref:hypothetical protein n=1 Tax=unclassified Haladaptatus TaxID=2622732 RepID=UPI0023E89C8D|nr:MULTISPECIES: hypothetical protein [unclassified Haladaptatus]
MESSISRGWRVTFSLLFGYFLVSAASEFVLDAASLSNELTIAVLSSLFAFGIVFGFILSTAVSRYAGRRGVPSSKSVSAFYLVITLVLLYSVGSTFVFVTFRNHAPDHSLVWPVTNAARILVAVVGGVYLYREQLGRSLSSPTKNQ